MTTKNNSKNNRNSRNNRKVLRFAQDDSGEARANSRSLRSALRAPVGMTTKSENKERQRFPSLRFGAVDYFPALVRRGSLDFARDDNEKQKQNNSNSKNNRRVLRCAQDDRR
jgi:hypothetical protein